jgi:alpha-glucosidase
MSTQSDWYKHAILYQIYPRSFADSNGDGVGDLKGISDHLDYVADLGVDGIWFSPINTSPMADYGYDVSDYRDIDPLFGTLDDFDNLLTKAHSLGLKILMDLVPNHTSDQHQWFKTARSSRENPKRDWYIWKDPKADGSEPNNWQSVFGGPAWQLDPKTGQYYLHSFLKEQPDLNWSNPEVQREIQDTMRFWFDRGVDGFRVDAILFTAKDQEYKDLVVPKVKEGEPQPSVFSMGFTDHLKSYIDVLTEVCHEYDGRGVFLEAYPHPEEDKSENAYAKLYQFCDNSVSAPFYFTPMHVASDWTAENFRDAIDSFESQKPEGGFSAYVLGNHDEPRVASKLGPDAVRTAAVALLTLPGSKVIYYGDELGMEDVHIPPEKIQDPSPVNRDPERTPMQWSDAPNAGFSDHEPWLPVEEDYELHNVQTELQNPTSTLSLYRALLKIYHEHLALSRGTYRSIETAHPDVFAYERSVDNETIMTLMNFSEKSITFSSPIDKGEVLISSTMQSRQIDFTKEITLLPNEGLVIQATP